MREGVTVAILTVTYNAAPFLENFMRSLQAIAQSGLNVETVVIDNGSSDGSMAWLRSTYPKVRVLENDENNYTRALNLGIAATDSDYVVITNNDATVHSDWLIGLIEAIQLDERIGAVQSKIVFADTQKINSAGVEEIEHFYFRDIGFNDDDSARYERAAEREYLTGGSVMFRRKCLEEVGDWDEEFIMFMEDVDYSTRCRKLGWKLWYAPRSILYHKYHGSSSQALCEYFCTRNRFLFVAKHFPRELPACIPTSHFYKKGEYDLLYRTLLHSVRALCQSHDVDVVQPVLEALGAALPRFIGEISACNFFSHLEILLGLRRIRVGIYDHAGHFAGGGQRYVAEMAAIMQERYDLTYIFNNDVRLSDYKDWFDLDLTRNHMKIIRIPFFEQRKRYTADEGMVLGEISNPFDIISRDTLNYDIFVNANMLGKVNPLSLVSIFVCHFPDQEKSRFFQVDKYDHLIINGDYTGEWVARRWQLTPTDKLNPPVNMYNAQSRSDCKESLILSVSRFEVSGSKKQLELIQAFTELCRQQPEHTRGWRLVLLGGSTPGNDYLRAVEEAAATSGCAIEVCANAAVAEIRDYYRRAAVFWHACGLNETRPERVEHFGMTTVESMQNYCVPIVIDGGGQREIVEHGTSGFRFSSLDELKTHTLTLLRNPPQRRQMAEQAYARSHLFSLPVFRDKLERLLDGIELELLGRDRLPGGGV